MSYLRGFARVKYSAKRIAEALLKVNIVARGRESHGISAFDDLKHYGFPLDTVFDVGANVGQFAFSCLQANPEAKLHCFEPEPRCYQELQRRITDSQVVFSSLALGETESEQTLYVTGGTTNSLKRPDGQFEEATISVSTLDQYLEANNISSVDLLKIDTEGYEMEVLRGATNAFRNSKIGAVLAEVGFSPTDPRHAVLETVRDFLTPYDFHVLGIYEQSPEWTRKPRLRFGNLLMVRQSGD
jgi:FkbM family methyltransferase